jgi:hypothetical protein
LLLNYDKEQVMELVNPEELRLVPGESMQAMFSLNPESPGQVGLFVRAVSEIERANGDLGILQRAGLIRFDDVLLVVTMLKLEGASEELFDIWWNYHAPSGKQDFRKMSEQDKLRIHFYSHQGKEFTVDAENGFRKFFAQLGDPLDKTPPWTDIEFHRAVRSFCAQTYPKDHLWEMIEFSPESKAPGSKDASTVDEYPGVIPEELRPFYEYVSGLGHCINIIPSMNEAEASAGDPASQMLPAPVKTVLRCGVRWTAGHPVAPVPFIPGHGLAVPPDDIEL